MSGSLLAVFWQSIALYKKCRNLAENSLKKVRVQLEIKMLLSLVYVSGNQIITLKK